jgi:hypothetical protein
MEVLVVWKVRKAFGNVQFVQGCMVSCICSYLYVVPLIPSFTPLICKGFVGWKYILLFQFSSIFYPESQKL